MAFSRALTQKRKAETDTPVQPAFGGLRQHRTTKAPRSGWNPHGCGVLGRCA